MKRRIAMILAAAMAVSTLAGCGGSTGGASQQAQEAVTAEEVSGTGETGETEAAEEAVEEKAEAPREDAAAADSSQELVGANTDGGELKPLAAFGGHMTGLRPIEEPKEPEGLSAEDTDKLDRAMRAYTPPADSPLINNAKSFYYYEQMSPDEQRLYDAMLMCASDPTTTDNVVVANSAVDPYSDEFTKQYLVAYEGLLYDHPELFWMYNNIDANMLAATPNEQTGDSYQIYFYFDEPYKDFENKMSKFNDAAQAFLADIDTSGSDYEIASQIHDKLIGQVAYNMPVMEDNTERGFANFAHTAYGALVEDSDGNANYAVCDGYSQAYVYLLQQCGLEAAVIVGVAGDSSSKGGHAWSVVKMDGDWYEVDSTWDDAGTLDEQVEEIKDMDQLSYTYFYEALNDQDYRDKLEHYLYCLTTPDMTHYVPDSSLNYVTKDNKYQFCLVGESEHNRASQQTEGYEVYGWLMDLAPEATGTKFGK